MTPCVTWMFALTSERASTTRRYSVPTVCFLVFANGTQTCVFTSVLTLRYRARERHILYIFASPNATRVYMRRCTHTHSREHYSEEFYFYHKPMRNESTARGGGEGGTSFLPRLISSLISQLQAGITRGGV